MKEFWKRKKNFIVARVILSVLYELYVFVVAVVFIVILQFVFPCHCLIEPDCALPKIFICAFVWLRAATSALSSPYPRIILHGHYHYVPSSVLVALHIICCIKWQQGTIGGRQDCFRFSRKWHKHPLPKSYWTFPLLFRTRSHVGSSLWRTSASGRWRSPGNLWVLHHHRPHPQITRPFSSVPVFIKCLNIATLCAPIIYDPLLFSRTVSSSTTPTTRARSSKPARRRQTDVSSRATTWFTEYQRPRRRRRRSGLNPSSKDPRKQTCVRLKKKHTWKNMGKHVWARLWQELVWGIKRHWQGFSLA